MMNRDYVETVRLMLRVIPLVFSTEVFAMKGGTAINLFLTDMPRLSVDIDVVFLPVRLSRDEALSTIAEELSELCARLASVGLVVREAHSADPLESQLLINDGDLQVKVEVNTVFRGSLMDVGRHSVHADVSEMFATEVVATLLAPSEIYAGKIMAALDRQHPRDLFDIWHLYQGDGLTDLMLDAFPVYLAGHNRPPHEVLNGKDKDIRQLYERALVGMNALKRQLLRHSPKFGRGLEPMLCLVLLQRAGNSSVGSSNWSLIGVYCLTKMSKICQPCSGNSSIYRPSGKPDQRNSRARIPNSQDFCA